MEDFFVQSERLKYRAHEDIAEAELLANSHHYLGAASRAYYACLHAILMLLANENLRTNSHKQAHIEFRRLFIKTGRFPKTDSVLIDQLFQLRQSSDYDPMFDIDPNDFKILLHRARDFVERAGTQQKI